MKTFEIEYIDTKNSGALHTTTEEGKDKTEAYLKFVCANPTHYIITDMSELIGDEDMISLTSHGKKFTVVANGKIRTFNTMRMALIFIKMIKEKENA